MSQYTPFYKAAEHGIGRRITTYEYHRVVNYAMDKGLVQGYMQQKSSAKEEYTPSFDLTGCNANSLFSSNYPNFGSYFLLHSRANACIPAVGAL